jgi:hypothetical protein
VSRKAREGLLVLSTTKKSFSFVFSFAQPAGIWAFLRGEMEHTATPSPETWLAGDGYYYHVTDTALRFPGAKTAEEVRLLNSRVEKPLLVSLIERDTARPCVAELRKNINLVYDPSTSRDHECLAHHAPSLAAFSPARMLYEELMQMVKCDSDLEYDAFLVLNLALALYDGDHGQRIVSGFSQKAVERVLAPTIQRLMYHWVCGNSLADGTGCNNLPLRSPNQPLIPNVIDSLRTAVVLVMTNVNERPVYAA